MICVSVWLKCRVKLCMNRVYDKSVANNEALFIYFIYLFIYLFLFLLKHLSTEQNSANSFYWQGNIRKIVFAALAG